MRRQIQLVPTPGELAQQEAQRAERLAKIVKFSCKCIKVPLPHLSNY